jgi:hypothetical protein
MSIRIGSSRKVKPAHRQLIIEEAIRLNGNATSVRGLKQLHSFAKKRCGIVLDDRTIKGILSGQQGSNGGAKPKTKRRSHYSRLCR